MKGGSPRRRGTAGWHRIDVDADNMPAVAQTLRDCGSLGGDGDPAAAHAYLDRQGRLRRVHATYANGWRATLSIRIDGSYSIRQAIKLVSPGPGGSA